MASKPRYGLTVKSLLYSILVHAALGALLLVSFTSAPLRVSAPPASDRIEPVKARMVSEAEIQQQIKNIKQQEDKKREQEEQAQKKLQQLLAEAKQVERKKKEEERKLDEAKKKRLQEKKKADELAKKRKQEQERLAKLEKEKERKEADAKKKAEEEKKERELAARKAKEEKARREAAEKKKREAELQAQLDEERIARRVDSLLSRYIPIIKQKVSRNWNKPANTPKGIEAKVQVRLSASGEVVSVRLVQSSGDSVFDRSVENAVHKASPLPIPQEHGVNEKFRNLNLIFKPEDLLS